MIKYKIEECKKVSTFPKLMVSKKDNSVVLARNAYLAIALTAVGSCEIGDSRVINPSEFEDFNGVFKLTNL